MSGIYFNQDKRRVTEVDKITSSTDYGSTDFFTDEECPLKGSQAFPPLRKGAGRDFATAIKKAGGDYPPAYSGKFVPYNLL